MQLSRLSRSLLMADRGPFLSPDGDGGGAAGAADSGNADSGGNGGQSDSKQGDQAGEAAKPEAVTFVHEGKTYVLQDHVNKLVGDARTDGKKTAETEATRLANEAAAKAKGDFEKLADDRQAQIELLQAQIADRDAADLKRTVAAKHKLPPDLAARLVGETEAELEADAKTLAKLVGAREAPDTEAGAGARGAAGTSDRPIAKKPAEGQKVPSYTFDGRPKVAWPTRS
jgi:hypothetical protein